MTRWSPERPYNDLPLLPPGGEPESREVLRRCIGARAALAELKQAALLIPNQGLLINTLPLLEAQASSEIENIVTTADNLFRHLESDGLADTATREALRYRHALMEGFENIDRPLGTRSAESICSRIRGVETQVRRVPGTRLANQNTGEVIYTPPEGEETLRRLLANWEIFIHGDSEMDPLVKLAVGHYQFEAIHPFVDGNGRTGRVINSLYLVQSGLLTLPILYLSRHIIRRKTEYYSLLLGVTRDASWEPWLLYMIEGVEETARWTMRKISAIRDLAEKTREYVRAELPKIYSHELIEAIFAQPYCRISTLKKAGIAKRQAASTYLKQLTTLGVLEERKAGREKLFIHPRLVRLLTTDDDRFKPYP